LRFGYAARMQRLFLVIGIPVFFGIVLLVMGGCSAIPKFVSVTEDHSVRLVSRPISAPAELAWRAKTFGEMTVSRMYIRYHRFGRLSRRLPVPALVPYDTLPPNESLLPLISFYSGPPVPGTVAFLTGGDNFFPRFEAAIASATNRIAIKTYIFDNDAYAMEIADQLKARNQQGVQVQVLLDLLGSRHAWNENHPDSPVQSESVNTLRYLRKDSTITVRQSRNLWLSSDHVKFFTIDGHTAYLGGMNIGWEYRYCWRDMMSELTGAVVTELDSYFDAVWKQAGWLGDIELLRQATARRHLYPARPGDISLHILVTTPWRHYYFRAMLAAIGAARHRIYVENAYLWNKHILYALCEARHRGVDVRVVIPMETNIKSIQGADRISANTLLEHGVRVFLYPGMTHKKATLIDDWAFWGSANMDDLSLHKNVELNLATPDAPTVQALEAIMLAGQDSATEILDPIPTRTWDALKSRLADLL